MFETNNLADTTFCKDVHRVHFKTFVEAIFKMFTNIKVEKSYNNTKKQARKRSSKLEKNIKRKSFVLWTFVFIRIVSILLILYGISIYIIFTLLAKF